MGDSTVVAYFGFSACVAIVAYVYVGYPLTLLLLSRRRSVGSRAGPLPVVTVLVAAYNEVTQIARTLRNKLEQDYPADRLDVLVVSDGSTDGTDDAVRDIDDRRLRLLRQEPRQGKTSALNLAVGVATGEILVFADANSQYEPRAIRHLVSVFDDATVGYATGRLVYVDPGDTAVGSGSGLYMRYENWIRRLETRAGSIVGVNGGIDAVRRSLYDSMRPDQLPDLILPLRVVDRGFRVVFVPEAVSRELALGRQRDEYRMRVRVSLRALHALHDMRSLLSPRHGLFAFQLFVHKLLRYLLFLPLLGAVLFCIPLAGSQPYAALLGVQAAFYLLAVIGWMSGGRIRWKPVFVPFYFCLINVAAAAALLRFVRGERQVLWTPRKGA